MEDAPDRRRRRLDEVFGDVLPATTSDERDARDEPATATSDQELLDNRPPHHDQD
jgi:hypothetical protein